MAKPPVSSHHQFFTFEISQCRFLHLLAEGIRVLLAQNSNVHLKSLDGPGSMWQCAFELKEIQVLKLQSEELLLCLNWTIFGAKPWIVTAIHKQANDWLQWVKSALKTPDAPHLSATDIHHRSVTSPRLQLSRTWVQGVTVQTMPHHFALWATLADVVQHFSSWRTAGDHLSGSSDL